MYTKNDPPSSVPPQHNYPNPGSSENQSYPAYPPDSTIPPKQFQSSQLGAPPTYQAAVPVQPNYAPPPGFHQSALPPPSSNPIQQSPPSGVDDEPVVKNFAFTDKTIRRGFIRKVYMTLSVQLFITFGIVLQFCLNSALRAYVQKELWVVYLGFGMSVVTIIPLACCECVRRTFPINLIFLGLLTLSEAVVVGVLGALYGPETVMIAMGLTVAMVIGLTIFAIQTKWDFTIFGGFLFVALIIFTITGIVAIFVRSFYLQLAISCIGVILFSIYLIYDTQLIVGGNRSIELSAEEYILGALMLYMDIIRIFMYLLHIVAAAKK